MTHNRDRAIVGTIMTRKKRNAELDYDVCLSFAGEDRKYVRQVADALRDEGIRTFYDEYEQVGLWGKDLYEHLNDVYKNTARYCVIFGSKHYAKKVWTNHERRSAQERALREHKEYILPAVFDNTEIPGMRSTIGYIRLAKLSPRAVAKLIVKKVGKTDRQNYLPPKPDRLFYVIGRVLHIPIKKEIIFDHAWNFLTVLSRMSPDERELIFRIATEGCKTEIPQNIHINLDLLRRVTGFPVSKIKRLLAKLVSLGFRSSIREGDEPGYIGKLEVVRVEWHDLSNVSDPESNATAVAGAMIDFGTEGLCPECAWLALRRLDFSQLARRTAKRERHGKRMKRQPRMP